MNSDFSGRTSRIPPSAAIGAAMVHTKKVLFQPFNALKWLKFGIVAFLINIFGQGTWLGFTPPIPGFMIEENGQPPPVALWANWCKEHIGLIIGIAVAFSIIITIIWTILIYFSSRFSFVYMDGVINNDMRIKEYYKANRATGWSYFMWRLGFIGVALPVILIALTPLAFSIFLMAQQKWVIGLILLFIGFIVFSGTILLLNIIDMFTIDFALPIMSLLKIGSLRAWGVLWTLIKNDKKTFIFYILLRWVLGIAAALLLAMTVSWLIYFILAIPRFIIIFITLLAGKILLIWLLMVMVILVMMLITGIVWNIIISPIAVFFRSYSLIVLEGFGDEFASINRF